MFLAELQWLRWWRLPETAVVTGLWWLAVSRWLASFSQQVPAEWDCQTWTLVTAPSSPSVTLQARNIVCAPHFHQTPLKYGLQRQKHAARHIARHVARVSPINQMHETSKTSSPSCRVSIFRLEYHCRSRSHWRVSVLIPHWSYASILRASQVKHPRCHSQQ